MSDFDRCIEEWADRVAECNKLITQQAQELEQAKGNYAIQQAAADDYEQQLAASQAKVKELEAQWHYAATHDADMDYVKEIAQLQATLAAREAEVDRLKLAQQHSIQDECEAEQRLIDAGISDYEDGGQGEYRGLLTQIDLCIKQRDAAVQEAGRLKEAAASLTCEVCKMDMQRAMKVSK